MNITGFLNKVIAVNGVEVTGFADGDDAVSYEYRTPRANDKVGADGKMVVSLSADKSATITLKLQEVSPSNKYLIDLCNLQRQADTMVPIIFSITDTYRDEKMLGSPGYIMQTPKFAHGQNANVYEWQIVVENMDVILSDSNGVTLGVSLS